MTRHGGFIGTGPLYIVEAILEAQNRDLEQVFPNPIPDLLPNADDLPQDPNKEHPVGIPIPLYYDKNGRVIWYYVYFEINWNNLYT